MLADLQRRLKSTRWPDDAGNEDWYYGVHRGCLEELVDYWRSGYDWRAAEAAINAYEHYRVQVEGVPVHFSAASGSAEPGPIDLHPRLALDVLALVQGDRPAGRPGRPRRRPGRGVRGDRPLVSRLRVLHPAARQPGHELLGRRPLAHPHDWGPRRGTEIRRSVAI
jgi:Epoxide hydrolase N terminus